MDKVLWLAIGASLFITSNLHAEGWLSHSLSSAPRSNLELQEERPPVANDLYRPQAGDLLLFQSRSVVMNVLAACTLSVGTTHAGIVVARNDGTLALLETPLVGSRVQLNDLPTRVQNYRGQISFRRPHQPLSAEQSANLTAFASAQLGKPYDFIGFVALPVSLPTRVFGNQQGGANALDAPRWFCSSLAVAGACSAGLVDSNVARPRGACADDLRTDRFLDLSASYASPIRIITSPCR